MNGGYADLPLAEFPLTLGGGRMMTYHARRGSYSSLRKVYFNYIDGLDQLQPIVDPWQDVSVNMGFPSLAFDPTLNRALFSWHESLRSFLLFGVLPAHTRSRRTGGL